MRYEQAAGSARKMGSVERTLTNRGPMLPVKGAEKCACHGPCEQAESATDVGAPGRTETTCRPPG
jgi:hypothetical protein